MEDVLNEYGGIFSSGLCEHYHTLQQIFDESTEGVDVMCSIATTLCGLFAMFYIGQIIWKSWCNGNSIDIYAIFKPFCYGLIIMNFGLFINIIEGLAEITLIEPTQKLVESKNAELNHLLLENLSKVVESNNESKESSMWESSLDWIKETLQDAVNAHVTAVNYIASSAFQIFGYLVGFIILVISTVYRIILYVFGPFVLALSILPTFSGSFNAWLGKYVTVLLYVPMVNVISYIGSMITIYFIETTNPFNAVLFNEASLFSIIIGICYICIPSLASAIVNSAGAASLTSEARKFGNASKQPAAAATKYVGGKAAMAADKIKNLFGK